MKTSWVLVAFLGFVFWKVLAIEWKIPDYIHLCKKNDENLSECYRNSFNAILPHLKKGIPQMNLAPIEPMEAQKLVFDYGNGTSLSFYAETMDTKFYGLSKMHLDKATIDLDKLEWWLDITVPSLAIDCKYKAKGRVLLFQFNSIGSARGNISDVKLKGVWYAKKYTKNGNEHVQFYDSKMNLTFGPIQMYFADLFPNKEINEEINRAINSNIDIFYKEIRPMIFNTVEQILIQTVNNVYKTFPMNVLYPE